MALSVDNPDAAMALSVDNPDAAMALSIDNPDSVSNTANEKILRSNTVSGTYPFKNGVNTYDLPYTVTGYGDVLCHPIKAIELALTINSPHTPETYSKAYNHYIHLISKIHKTNGSKKGGSKENNKSLADNLEVMIYFPSTIARQ